MLLKAIDIQGFKSFPDKTSLRFGEGITAVVGPNGSGKSNIADAVRWVLGEQSSRSLRGLKMEDVIFGGTAKRKPLGFAEVSLHIDNRSRGLHFDADEVQVTRRYYRSGESEYFINRTAVRLKDIHELFMDTGLGRDGYSMVGQGKIDAIVSSGANDRREIFEEAAGISRFRYRKTEAERRLKSAEENLLRLRDIAAELESRIEPLRIQSEKAQKFLRLSEEKKELEIGLWLIRLDKIKERLREADIKIEQAAASRKAVDDELERLNAEGEALSAEAASFLAEAEGIRRRSAEIEEEIARITGEIAVLENTVFHNGENIARIRKEKEEAAGSDSDIAAAMARHEAQIAEKLAFVETRKAELDQAREALISLQNQGAEFSKQIEELNAALNETAAAAADIRVRMMMAKSAAAELSVRMSAAGESLQSERARLENARREEAELAEDVRALDEKIQSLQNALKGHEMRLSTRREKVRVAAEKADALRAQISEKNRRASILEDLEKNMEGYSAPVKLIAKLAERGELRGIHGPLSRIVKVPPEYATAIETALGAAMQHIVTGNEEDAKRAIRLLKDRSAGRATFLPLTSVKGRSLDESGLSNMPGFVGAADALAEYEPRYADAVRSVLGRVAVARDLDAAVAIARKYGYRFKIVTLDGQVVNAGGSLTGGSVVKSAGLLSRGPEIRRLREEAAALSARLTEAEAALRVATEESAAAEAQITALRAELTTAGEDRIRAESERERFAKECEERRRSAAALEAELKQGEDRLRELADEERRGAAEIDALNLRRKETEEELARITGGRDELTQNRERLTEEITAARMALAEAEKDIAAGRDTLEMLRARRENEAERLRRLDEEADRLEEENRRIAEEIAGKRARIPELRAQAAETEETVRDLYRRREEREAAVARLRTLEREKLGEREALAGETVRLEERKNAVAAEFDEIVGKLFDEYQLTRSEAEELDIVIDDPVAAAKRLAEIKSAVRSLGVINLEAIDEYREVKERYDFLTAQVEDVEKSKAELQKLIADLTRRMREMFVEKFEIINGHFRNTFVELFEGGEAELRLTDPENVLESGIEIIVRPPGKNITIIEQLSGGEKALVAVAIYFAVMKVNPPPFCVLDEVEAALDDVNVTRFAEYLRRMSARTQFIVITHRRGTMEEADVLYGVTMQEKGVSKLLKLEVSELERHMTVTA